MINKPWSIDNHCDNHYNKRLRDGVMSFSRTIIKYFRNSSRSSRPLLNERDTDALIQLNMDLQKRLRSREMVILQLNARILNYANIHSHRVRGPLVRIIGLLNLKAVDKDLDTNFLLKKILECALELDDVIKVLGRSLDQDSDHL